MTDLDGRKLERILRRDGTLHQFVLTALEAFDREDLGLVLDRTMELYRQKDPANEALERGLRDGARLESGEITPDELVEELEARPLRQRDPMLPPERVAEVSRVVRALISGGPL
jgi:hypothetical protein